MADIDTRTVELGRYFTPSEVEHHTNVCLIGDTLVQQLFLGTDPIGKAIRLANDELLVIGVMEKVGSVLGRIRNKFVMVPLPVFLRMKGLQTSVTITLRPARRNSREHRMKRICCCERAGTLSATMDDDFFIGTKESYMAFVAQHQLGVLAVLSW